MSEDEPIAAFAAGVAVAGDVSGSPALTAPAADVTDDVSGSPAIAAPSVDVSDVPGDMSLSPGPAPSVDLRARSVRTLAWLGDAEFEREVRMRLSQRGDFPTDRLHAMTARVVCAEAQAELLAAIEAGLDEAELGVVRRARNLNTKAGGRGVRSVRDYRSATALEALVAHWCFGAPGGRARFEALVSPWLAVRIDAALLAAGRALRRG